MSPPRQVESSVMRRCSQEFDSPLLRETVATLQDTVVCWITHIYGTTMHAVFQYFQVCFSLPAAQEIVKKLKINGFPKSRTLRIEPLQS